MPQAKQVASAVTLDQFARSRVAGLLDRLDSEVNNVCRKCDPDAIHDLRVSIRRLTQALRALRALFSKGEIKPVRRSLREMMDIAAGIRNRDIALELFAAAGVAADATVPLTLARQRDAERKKIVALARKWRRDKLPVSWKALVNGRPA
ncbi:MAG: CHAD domain-containing protein [Acidobacteria bacterium]|nr:CHAD domain-containing protein [Acidobacteriota bacterium]